MNRWSRRWIRLAVGVLVIAGVAGGWVWWHTARAVLPSRESPDVRFPADNPFASGWSVVEAFPGVQFDLPLAIVQSRPEPGTYYVAQQAGLVVSVVAGPPAAARPFLDLRSQVVKRGEAGLVGLALHPDYGDPSSTSGRYFYVFYVTESGGRMYDRLSRFEASPDFARADPATELVLIEQLDEDTDHNSGNLVFGPDGFLYVGVGDEGGIGDSFKNGQRIDKDLFSGILRIDLECRGSDVSHPVPRQPETGRTQGYCVPHDNPFVGVPRALEEFWSIGLRNPHRFSFDGTTVWGGDIGQDRVEKVFRASRGSNHQWSYREGTVPFTRSYLAGVPPKPPIGTETAPAFEYAHTNGNGAVIGGYVYRGALFPELAGKYVFGDFNSGRIWALEAPNVRTLLTLPADRRLTSFGIDRDGELLLCVFGKPSTILRLARK